MDNNEMLDIKAEMVQRGIVTMNDKFRMFNWKTAVWPAKINSDLTVVCMEFKMDRDEEVEWDIKILKLSDLSFLPTNKSFTSKD